MPEFLLTYTPPGRLPPIKRSFITKNEYSRKVKVAGWENRSDSDTQGLTKRNLLKSTFDRLGSNEISPVDWKTETQESLERTLALNKKFTFIDPVYMVSYGNYDESCMPENEEEVKYDKFFTDYLSTMHADYKCPTPMVIKPLQLPSPPWLMNRRMQVENPKYETNKFLDDCCIEKTKNMVRIKGSRSKSYNPGTGKYTDGSEPETKKYKCYDLPYSLIN